MSGVPFDHPIEQALVVALLTLIVKWIYDLISHNDTMRTKDCINVRKLCHAEREADKAEADADCSKREQIQEGHIKDRDTAFTALNKRMDRMESILSAQLETLLLICKSTGIDCSDITKAMVRKGVLD